MFELRFNAVKGLTEKKMEKLFSVLGLGITMKGSLKTFPENIHWHLKLGNEPGVCEITLLKGTNELIINCKKNRKADWINAVAVKVQGAFGE